MSSGFSSQTHIPILKICNWIHSLPFLHTLNTQSSWSVVVWEHGLGQTGRMKHVALSLGMREDRLCTDCTLLTGPLSFKERKTKNFPLKRGHHYLTVIFAGKGARHESKEPPSRRVLTSSKLWPLSRSHLFQRCSHSFLRISSPMPLKSSLLGVQHSSLMKH